MTTDHFRSLFLRQVRAILSSTPSRETLRQLLAMADPEVTDEDLDNEAIRTRVLKELRKRVHPDKHPNDDTATGIFQDVPPFYEACCGRLHVPVGATSQNAQTPLRSSSSVNQKETKMAQTTTANDGSSSTTTWSEVSFPSEFTVTDTWPFMPLCHPVAPQAGMLFENNNNDNDSALELLLAYQCINARGAVAHRARPGLFFGWNKVAAEPHGTTAEQLWQKKFRGARRFGEDGNNSSATSTTTIANQIKEELMSRGPVVSVSFVLSPVLKQHNGSAIGEAFFWQHRMNQTHAVMIVGWKLTAFGEVWLVYPPRVSGGIAKHKSVSDILIPIAFGQFGIDTLCLAPASDLLDKVWQPGPFLDLNLSKWPDKWMGWKKCDVHLTSNELQRLSECLGTGFVAAATSGRKEPLRFVLRDEKKLAHSRAFCLKDVQWNPVKKLWKITIIRQGTD